MGNTNSLLTYWCSARPNTMTYWCSARRVIAMVTILLNAGASISAVTKESFHFGYNGIAYYKRHYKHIRRIQWTGAILFVCGLYPAGRRIKHQCSY